MTKEEINAAVQLLVAMAQTIRQLKTVPSGHLYAHVMGKVSLEQYENLIGILIDKGMVKRRASHELEWIGQ